MKISRNKVPWSSPWEKYYDYETVIKSVQVKSDIFFLLYIPQKPILQRN